MKFNNIPVASVEYGVFRWPRHMDGWRMYRLEYGGCNEDCLAEQTIWLPPNMSVVELTELINKYAKEGEKLDRDYGLEAYED